jgi:hypothetical protein
VLFLDDLARVCAWLKSLAHQQALAGDDPMPAITVLQRAQEFVQGLQPEAARSHGLYQLGMARHQLPAAESDDGVEQPLPHVAVMAFEVGGAAECDVRVW